MGDFLYPPKHYEEHEHLRNAPIEEAACQISFPPILRINEGIDSRMQDLLSDFPIINTIIETETQINIQATSEIITTNKPAYQFSTESKFDSAIFRAGSFTFQTIKYDSWSQFVSKLKKAYEAFVTVYNPPFTSRIDIRFINVIEKELFDPKSGRTISDIIEPLFLGPMEGFQFEENSRIAYTAQLLINNDVITSSQINYGFFMKSDPDKFAYLIDTDVYSTKQRDKATVFEDLEKYHNYAYDIFRWIIKDEFFNLHFK